MIYIQTLRAKYAVTDSVFRNDVFGGVIGEYFVLSAVDAAKGKDVPSGLSGLHRKTPDGGARCAALDSTMGQLVPHPP